MLIVTWEKRASLTELSCSSCLLVAPFWTGGSEGGRPLPAAAAHEVEAAVGGGAPGWPRPPGWTRPPDWPRPPGWPRPKFKSKLIKDSAWTPHVDPYSVSCTEIGYTNFEILYHMWKRRESINMYRKHWFSLDRWFIIFPMSIFIKIKINYKIS